MTIPGLTLEVIMPLRAVPVMVLPEEREVLEQLVRAHSTPQQLVMRARLILQAADGVGVRESAREVGVWPKTARYWRRRWRQGAEGRSTAERLSDARVRRNRAKSFSVRVSSTTPLTLPVVTRIAPG